ncbi:Exonuclease RNase T and DNA polymerase III [Lapidilactobacillus concavus DSM 17758]|jgi:DNA polymerase-3 subunit epsilon|uniref:DNA polymerase III polC-type n=1 Tax=Lapidilactobacillus concavus DSM 17758 TaxID=1423735 RepID=A0A0R1W7K3_9LACO|nr:3'-5' exonuclease [Lapidilactobacillus concavus]KRM13687.1 Exonuclease RNase T and DNA polymerase III [Lapidilactobacillus concavus DSM 17758]GEL12859.1 exonuclease [Lapidilactobacillus concavus]
MNFIAIDFETANSKPDSACSLAIVAVRHDQIVNNFYTLINPQSDFNIWNTRINGLNRAKVATAPTFDQVWQHISTLFSMDQLVAAHNAKFDIKVLQQTLLKYEIEPPHFLAVDTVKTSRRLYPELPNHKLDTVSRYLQIELNNHHNALADSYACANILLAQEQQFGQETLKKLVTMV